MGARRGHCFELLQNRTIHAKPTNLGVTLVTAVRHDLPHPVTLSEDLRSRSERGSESKGPYRSRARRSEKRTGRSERVTRRLPELARN